MNYLQGIVSYSDQRGKGYKRESEGQVFGMINIRLGNLVVKCSVNLLVGLCSSYQKILTCKIYLGIVSFGMDVLLTLFPKPRVIYHLDSFESICSHCVLIFLSCGMWKDLMADQLSIGFYTYLLCIYRCTDVHFFYYIVM